MGSKKPEFIWYIMALRPVLAKKQSGCYNIIRLENMNFREVFIMAKEKRFEKVYSQGCGSTEIWVDKETGVNYMFHSSGYAGGLTPLLDKDGKPIVTHIEE